MKKIFKRAMAITLSAVLLLSSGICLSAKNTEGEVAYGTPVIDGKLDKAYLKTEITESLRKKIFYYQHGGGNDNPISQADAPSEATSYFLWDEDYFYTCTIVKDETIFALPIEYYYTGWPWEDDGVEYWLRNPATKQSFSLHIDASDVIWYGYANSKVDENIWLDVPSVGQFSLPNYTNMNCGSQKAYSYTEDGYIVETAVRLQDGAKFSAGFQLMFGLQVNNILDEKGDIGYAIGSQSPHIQGATLTFAEKPVVSDNAGTMTVSGGEFIAGDTIELPVTLENNPGVSAMIVAPKYDATALELVEIKAGEGVFANGTAAKNYVWKNEAGDVTDGGTVCTLVFKVLDTAPHGDSVVSIAVDASNWEENLADIAVVDGTVSIHGAADLETLEAIAPTCTETGLTEGLRCATCGKSITEQEVVPVLDHADADEDGICDVGGEELNKHIPGDINNDGAVDAKDLTRLMKYIAGSTDEAYGPDVTGDGAVDTKDLSRLMKYLAGQEVELF